MIERFLYSHTFSWKILHFCLHSVHKKGYWLLRTQLWSFFFFLFSLKNSIFFSSCPCPSINPTNKITQTWFQNTKFRALYYAHSLQKFILCIPAIASCRSAKWSDEKVQWAWICMEKPTHNADPTDSGRGAGEQSWHGLVNQWKACAPYLHFSVAVSNKHCWMFNRNHQEH